jgi:hypothetical protein
VKTFNVRFFEGDTKRKQAWRYGKAAEKKENNPSGQETSSHYFRHEGAPGGPDV